MSTTSSWCPTSKLEYANIFSVITIIVHSYLISLHVRVITKTISGRLSCSKMYFGLLLYFSEVYIFCDLRGQIKDTA